MRDWLIEWESNGLTRIMKCKARNYVDAVTIFQKESAAQNKIVGVYVRVFGSDDV